MTSATFSQQTRLKTLIENQIADLRDKPYDIAGDGQSIIIPNWDSYMLLERERIILGLQVLGMEKEPEEGP